MYRTLVSRMIVGGAALVLILAGFPAISSVATEHEDTMLSQYRDSQADAAQRRTDPTTVQALSEPTMPVLPQSKRLGNVIGKPVRDAQGQRLGTVEDIVLNSQGDSISYAVLSYGGFLGLGDKLFAVPWSEFSAHPTRDAYTLDVRREYLRDAPGFPKDNWPDMVDEDWAQRVETFYREGRWRSDQAREDFTSDQPRRADAELQLPMRYRRVSGLIRLPAKDYQGETLGRLQDLVIDSSDDTVSYGVVLLNTTPWELERREALVPWSTVEVMPDLAALRLEADEELLDTVAFARGEFPDLSNPQYVQSIESQYESRTPYWETLGYVPGRGAAARQEIRPDTEAKHVRVSAWLPGSEHNRRFDPELVTTVRGKIESIDVFRIDRNAPEGLRLKVRTQDGATETVYAGPRPFFEGQNVTLNFGDEITVTGAPTRVGWAGSALMASTIQKGDQTLRLRSEDGTPQWNTDDLLGRRAYDQ